MDQNTLLLITVHAAILVLSCSKLLCCFQLDRPCVCVVCLPIKSNDSLSVSHLTFILKGSFFFLDGDEPLLSGSGVVSKEVTDDNLLEAWHDVLVKWHQNLSQRPKPVQQLAKKGIPEALRGEVWQLLAGCHDNSELMEAYRILITKVRENNNSKIYIQLNNQIFWKIMK